MDQEQEIQEAALRETVMQTARVIIGPGRVDDDDERVTVDTSIDELYTVIRHHVSHLIAPRMQAETTIGLLDQYLLAEGVSQADILDCFDRNIEMPYVLHLLELSGLSAGLPEDKEEAVRRMFRLRLFFAGKPDAESVLLEQLQCLRYLHLRLQAYIRNDISRRDLQNQIEDAFTDYHASAEVRQSVAALRYLIVDEPQHVLRVDRVDVVNTCFKTMRRLEALWFVILG